MPTHERDKYVWLEFALLQFKGTRNKDFFLPFSDSAVSGGDFFARLNAKVTSKSPDDFEYVENLTNEFQLTYTRVIYFNILPFSSNTQRLSRNFIVEYILYSKETFKIVRYVIACDFSICTCLVTHLRCT